MRFGNQSITVVSVAENLAVRDVYNHPAEDRTETIVPGCRVRPLPAREAIELGDKVNDPWRITAPPTEIIVGLKSGDEIKVDGVTFQVLGLPRVFPDLYGRLHKTTILVERVLA
jgi:hypothetical protein